MLDCDLLTKTIVYSPVVTPHQTAGPFYPAKIDVGADLVLSRGHNEKTIGDIVVIEGVVMDEMSHVVPGALVEIWQACATGRYNHVDDPNTASLDPHFQYWGKAITDANGSYRFRTIVPGSYPAEDDWDRPAHIHFKITHAGYEDLVTQMYFKHDPLNNVDQILQALSQSDQDMLIVDFKKQTDQKYPVGQFNIQIKKID